MSKDRNPRFHLRQNSREFYYFTSTVMSNDPSLIEMHFSFSCSSDLVHLYANIREYLDLPYTSAFIGVCLPKISLNIEMNLLESLKSFDDFYHSKKFTEHVFLAGARSFGHFSLSMSNEKPRQSSEDCLHSIDLSPVTPWMFFVNRPFLFFLTSADSYLLVGQMLTANEQVQNRSQKLEPIHWP